MVDPRFKSTRKGRAQSLLSEPIGEVASLDLARLLVKTALKRLQGSTKYRNPSLRGSVVRRNAHSKPILPIHRGAIRFDPAI